MNIEKYLEEIGEDLLVDEYEIGVDTGVDAPYLEWEGDEGFYTLKVYEDDSLENSPSIKNVTSLRDIVVGEADSVGEYYVQLSSPSDGFTREREVSSSSKDDLERTIQQVLEDKEEVNLKKIVR